MSPKLPLLLTALVPLLASPPARALTFNFTSAPNDTLTADQAAAFRAAADVWSASLSDAITVNLQIGFTSRLAANVLGATAPTLLYGPQSYIAGLLRADSKTATDREAAASLSTSTQSTLAVTSAEAKALGAAVPSSVTTDGTIEFSTAFTFSTARNGDGSIAAGTYDLIGIAEHEIGHLLGFVSSIDGGTGNRQTLLDQFRYASGRRSVAAGTPAGFSIDGGLTLLADFSTGVVNGSGDQASHWALGTAAVMAPEVGAGQTQNITALDILALDAIGYDAVAVPEPWSLGLLGIGTIAAGLTRRRRS